MCDERKVETIESLCEELQRFVDAGLGDCEIKCFDGFLYDDAIMIDPQKRICKIRGYVCDTDLGQKVGQLSKKLRDDFDEYYRSINVVRKEDE